MTMNQVIQTDLLTLSTNYMRKYFFALLAIPALVAGCQSMDEDGANILTGNSLAQQMTGEWSAAVLHVEAKSWKGTDIDSTFTITQAEFNETFGFDKNKGVYQLDGTFEEFFISAVDTVLSKVSGNWDAKGDTVYVQQMNPNISENHYHFELKGDTGYFKGYLDWDRDGKKDDFFISKALKSPLPVE